MRKLIVCADVVPGSAFALMVDAINSDEVRTAGLLSAWEDDLDVDRAFIESAKLSETFVWVVRKHGTELARVRGTKWERERVACVVDNPENIIYKVRIGRTPTIERIAPEVAKILMDQPPYVSINKHRDVIHRDRVIGTLHCKEVEHATVSLKVELFSSDQNDLERDIEAAASDWMSKTHGIFVRIADYSVCQAA